MAAARAALRAAETAVVVATGAATADILTETVVYEHDGTTLEGYLAEDSAARGQRPVVLVIHQWMGLSDNERMRAEMLAEMGYVALAADVYGQGIRPENTDQAREQAMKYYGDRELFRARLAAGLAEHTYGC